jgi:hypothetical protein
MHHGPLDYEVCIHEAGHAVVACLRGVAFLRVEVDYDLDTEQTTGMLSRPRGTPTDAEVSLAGPAALAFYRGEAGGLDFRRIESSPGARGDVHGLFRFWYGLGSREPYYGGEFARRIEALFRAVVGEVIEPLFPAVRETARRLQGQQILYPPDVRAVLAAHGPSPSAHSSHRSTS